MLAIPQGTCALWRRLHHTSKRKAVFLCRDQGVCARTSLHTCACVHACVSVRLSRSEKKLEFHSSSIIHVLSFILLSFATRFFTGLQLVQACWPKNPRDPPTSTSLPPQCRHCKCTPSCLAAYKGGFWESNSSPLAWKASILLTELPTLSVS